MFYLKSRPAVHSSILASILRVSTQQNTPSTRLSTSVTFLPRYRWHALQWCRATLKVAPYHWTPLASTSSSPPVTSRRQDFVPQMGMASVESTPTWSTSTEYRSFTRLWATQPPATAASTTGEGKCRASGEKTAHIAYRRAYLQTVHHRRHKPPGVIGVAVVVFHHTSAPC